MPYNNSGKVRRRREVLRLNRPEVPGGKAQESGEESACAGTDEKVVAPIAVHVAPSQSGTEPTQPIRQKKLRGEVIELVFEVFVRKARGEIFEEERLRRRLALGQPRSDEQK